MISEKLTRNYRIVDGCHNCEHAFAMHEYDEAPRYFCRKNAPERPLCLSVYMQEVPKDNDFSKAYYAWKEWSDDREVEAFGTCDWWTPGVSRTRRG